MAYLTPLAGESEYARIARALNTYQAGSSDYQGAVDYANSQGWGGMVPTAQPSGANVSGLTSLRDAATTAGLDLGYNPQDGLVSLSYKGGTPLSFKAEGGYGGTTYDGSGTNYINDPASWQKTVDLLKGSTVKTPAPVTPLAAPPTFDYQSAFADMMGQMSGMVSQPQTNSGSLEDALASVKAAADPLHAIKLKDLEQKQMLAEKSLMGMVSGAGGGAYDSSEAVRKMAELKGGYLDATALEDAQYQSDMMNLASGVYQAGLNRDSQSEASYNAAISSLASAALSGSVDLARFAMDDAYRKAVLAQDEAHWQGTNYPIA